MRWGLPGAKLSRHGTTKHPSSPGATINIVANAVKCTPSGGSVTLSADAPAPDTVHLRVTDSGPGIPPEMQSSIFEPFRQLRERPAGTDGVGLGLAISRTLARASGGDVTVESAPGAGATFVVRLPRAG